MSTIFSAGLMVLAGYGLLRLLAGRLSVRQPGVVFAAGLAPLLGAVVVGLVTTFVGLLGLSTKPLPFIAPVVALFALVAVLPAEVYRAMRLPAVGRRWSVPDDGAFMAPPGAVKWADRAVAVVVGVFGAVMLTGSGRLAVSTNDEFAIWAVRGRTLSLAGHLDPTVFVHGADAAYQHLDYPLLQPALLAWGDGMAGHLDDASAHVLLILLTLGLLAVVGCTLNRIGGPVAGVCGILLIAGTAGVISKWGLYLMADIPLASFVVAAVAMLSLWVTHGDTRWLAIGTALAAGAAATKVEGSLFAWAAFLALLLFPPRRPAARKQALLAMVIVFVTTLPWDVWTRAHGIRSDQITGQTLSPAHLRVVAPYAGLVVREIVKHWPGYGWLGVFAAAAAAVLALFVPRCRRLVGFVVLTWMLGVLGMWGQYVISAGQHMPTSQIGASLKGHMAGSARHLIVPSILLSLVVPVLAGAAVWSGRWIREVNDPSGADATRDAAESPPALASGGLPGVLTPAATSRSSASR